MLDIDRHFDCELLKSLPVEGISENLMKSLNKQGLVQKEVTVKGKNGQTFTRKQWVKVGQDVTDNNLSPKDDTSSNNKTLKNQTTNNGKQKLAVMLSSGKSRDEIMDEFKNQGVTWKEHSHPAINWMRASMAIQEHMSSNTSDTHDDTSNAHDASEKSQKKDTTEVKEKVKELVKKLGGRDNILNSMKSQGISWSEHSHPAINWMRAMQALSKVLSENPSMESMLLSSEQVQSQLKDTQTKVQELQDLVSKIQSPTAQQVQQQSAKLDILKGITVDTKSSYEKKNFGSVISSASPESLRNYRTLGMCAGDADSEKYLAQLYRKYSNSIQGNSSIKSSDDIDADPLRNRLQGVVNKQVVGVVKSSLKNIRKRTQQFTVQQKLLEPWVDPNSPLTDDDREFIKSGGGKSKSYGGAGFYPGDRRKERQTETDCGHELMHKVLSKFKQSSEYGKLASEYDTLLSEFDNLTQSNSIFQNSINGVGNGSPISTPEKYEKGVKFSIDQQVDKYQSMIDKTSDSDQITRMQQKIEDLRTLSSRVSGKDLVKAAEIRQKLFDPKFIDLNANLYHYKQMASQLSFQYEIKKDFVSEYPVLSKDNLDKLDLADEDSLTNLSLYAGMFKPSLSKTGKSAKDVLLDKYSERQSFLDAYGGVTQIQGNSGYAENNEIRCKVSKASPKKSQEIIDNIAKDWDKQSHGRMKYKINGVYEVSGLALDEQFSKIKKQNDKYKGVKAGGKDCGSDLFYHGTGSMATSLILGHSGEFKLVKAKVGRMLGDGIYLADKSSKSAQYIGDEGYSRSGIKGSLMVVEASLGNTLSARTSGGKQYDSVYAGKNHGLLNSEWCVHDPQSVIPRYLVEMEIL